MESSYKEENFLEAAFGNFLDRIKNSVYGLQRYIDMFHPNSDYVLVDFKNSKDNQTKEMMKFILLESENISQYKTIHFAVETENIIHDKYESLIKSIEHDADNHRYMISFEAYMYLESYIREMDYEHITDNQYKKKPKSMSNIYDFDDYMNKEFDVFNKLKFKLADESISKQELIIILNGAFMQLSVVMLNLKRMLEQSNSLFTRSIICRKIITILIITYVVVSTIQFE
jgi:hypothetical protein